MRDRFIEKYTIESKPRVWNMLWLERQNMMIYIGILSSPTCRSVNGVDIFNFTPRCKHNHDHCHYKSPILHDVLLNDRLHLNRRHHIRSKLLSLSHAKLNSFEDLRWKATSQIRNCRQTYNNGLGYSPSHTFQIC